MKLNITNILHFGVDELEVYGTFYNYEILFAGIDDENSDFISFGEFTLLKTSNMKDYKFKIDFIKDNYRCFAFYVGKPINKYITTKNYFKVYGTAFKLFEIEEIIEFINSYIINDDSFEDKNNVINSLNLRLKRFDLAIDIIKNLEKEILNNFKQLNQKGSKYYGSKGNLETYYIGEYRVRDNRGFLIRIYDKKADIIKKNKQALYGEYLEQENVTRIEVEFRSELVKSILIEKLLDREYLLNLFILYLEKHTDIFNTLKTEGVKRLSRLRKKVDIEELITNKILQKKYIQAFLGYAEKIFKVIGYCPTKILLEHHLISEQTKIKITNSFKNGKIDIYKFFIADDE